MMKKQWTTVFLILIALIVVLFAVLNVDPIAINFGFTIIEMPLAVILIVTLLIGVLMAVLLSTGIILNYKSEEKKLRKEIEAAEAEKEREKENLIQSHQQEIEELIQEKEHSDQEIRQLNRRISNMDASANTNTQIEE